MIRIGALTIGLLLLAGCASVDTSNYRQVVLVRSTPAGAKIFQHGDEIGVTPAYVPIRRQRKAALELRFPNGEKRVVPLTTKYRWGDSFASDLLFLNFAPVAWLVDLETETAWRFEDPPEAVQEGAGGVPSAPKVVAVAPPMGTDSESGDAVGQLVARKLTEQHRFKVLDYERTAPVFNYYNSDHGISDSSFDNHRLYYTLKADHVFVSSLEPRDDGFHVNGRLRDVYTGRESDSNSWDVTSSDASLNDQLSFNRFISDRFHLFPNTLFLNLSTLQPSMDINSISYKGTSETGHQWYDQVVNYVSYLSLSHLERPRRNVIGQFVFDFVPTVNLSHKKISFPTYAPLNGSQFDRLYVNGGYGIELGYLSRYGFAYLDAIPALTWTQLSVRSPNGDESLQSTTLTTTVEYGYSYFFSPHFVGKIFTRALPEDSKLWQRAIRQASNATENISNSNSFLTGIALGYYFPSNFEGKSSWRIR
jgi:hypothetical protein